MRCDEIQPLYDAYLDSELDTKTTLEIQQHVATCAECARLFATEAKLDARLMAGLRQGQRTAALWEQIERRVAAKTTADDHLPHESPGALDRGAFHPRPHLSGKKFGTRWNASLPDSAGQCANSSGDSPRDGWLSTLNAQLSTLLWPHPKAWAGLAAAWLLILTVNLATRETSPMLEARRATPLSPATLRLLKQQEQLLAELSGQPEPREAGRPKATSPRPRTERRDEMLNA